MEKANTEMNIVCISPTPKEMRGNKTKWLKKQAHKKARRKRKAILKRDQDMYEETNMRLLTDWDLW